MKFAISIFLGLIPEVLYFTFFLIYTKNLKYNKFKLFLSISIIYVLCIMINQYKILYYICFVVLVYIILKILYRKKAQIIDIFAFGVSTFYLTFVSYICFLFVDNNITKYIILYIIDRILIFAPFVFRHKFNTLYKKYCKLWNRNDKEKRPIKSITLRNISLVAINFIIVFMNIYMILIE